MAKIYLEYAIPVTETIEISDEVLKKMNDNTKFAVEEFKKIIHQKRFENRKIVHGSMRLDTQSRYLIE